MGNKELNYNFSCVCAENGDCNCDCYDCPDANECRMCVHKDTEMCETCVCGQ